MITNQVYFRNAAHLSLRCHAGVITSVPMHIPDPPESFSRSGGFESRGGVGRRWLSLIKEAGLTPNGSVLDVGCGLGRIAVPLAGYLTGGRYEGFDVDRAAVEWCQQNITPVAPHFRFQAVEVVNDKFRQQGSGAESFRFPHEDGLFDVAFLASVFTHMVTAEVFHYLAELHRVLRPSGRLVASYFLLNEESETAIREARIAPRYRFPHALDGCRVRNKAVASMAVAYPEAGIQKMYQSTGLSIIKTHYGRWRGRSDAYGNQDVIIAVKP